MLDFEQRFHNCCNILQESRIREWMGQRGIEAGSGRVGGRAGR